MKKALIILMALFSLSGAHSFAQLSSWKLTKDYNVTFSCKGVDGILKRLTANIIFNEKELSESRFVITIDVSSLNTGNALQNKHALGEDWFDVKKYPTVKFISTSFQKDAKGYIVVGKMFIKDKVKEISIPFIFDGGGSSRVFKADFIIKRSDYGVGLLTEDVENNIEIKVNVPVVESI